jgi:hypothetical protein
MNASSSREPASSSADANSASAAAAKPNAGLPSHIRTSAVQQNILPGAITSQDKSFEGAIQSKSANRNPNTLPGAILLEGAFDMESSADSGEYAKNSHHEYLPKSVAGSTIAGRTISKRATSSSHSKVEGRARALVSVASETAHTIKTDDSEAKIAPKEGRSRSKGGGSGTAQKIAVENEGADADSEADAKSGSNAKTNIKREKSIQSHRKSRAPENRPTSRSEGVGGGAVVHNGPHPMSRTMTELQVEGDTGPLDIRAVKQKYGALVKAYLAPFAKGVSRKAFFAIMRRKNYSLAPPNSNKGVQTILFQIIKQSSYPGFYDNAPGSIVLFHLAQTQTNKMFSDVVNSFETRNLHDGSLPGRKELEALLQNPNQRAHLASRQGR